MQLEINSIDVCIMTESNHTKQSEEDVVHVAIVRDNLFDEDYNRHTAATMASVMENCSKTVYFHLVYGFPNSRNKNELLQIIGKFDETVYRGGGDIEYHFMELNPKILSCPSIQKSLKFWGTPVGLFRLYLPEILTDIDFCYSLGSDVIVKTDLAKLLENVPKNYSIYGISDYTATLSLGNARDHIREIGIENPEHWLCADVLLFNLKKIRDKKTLPKKGIRILYDTKSDIYFEQDILSMLYDDDMCILPAHYNIQFQDKDYVQQILERRPKNSGYILHYGGGVKPWVKCDSIHHLEYYKYLSHTPYGDNDKVFQLMKHVITTDEDFMECLPDYIWKQKLTKKIKIMMKIYILIPFTLVKRYLSQHVVCKGD